MSWGNFLIAIAIIYPVYYSVIILMDISKKRKKGENRGYQVIEVEEENEETIVTDDFLPTKDLDDTDTEVTPEVGRTMPETPVEIEIGERGFQSYQVDEFVSKARELSAAIDF